MWAKLDDGLIDHRKVFVAGDAIGRNGPAIAIGMYSIGLMWTNKQLSNGFLPLGVVKHWTHVERPLVIAAALVEAGLWETTTGGFLVHDFHDHNPEARTVLAKRKRDRDRKRRGEQTRDGNHAE